MDKIKLWESIFQEKSKYDVKDLKAKATQTITGQEFGKRADNEDIIAMAVLVDKKNYLFDQYITPIIKDINKLRTKYKLKPIEM